MTKQITQAVDLFERFTGESDGAVVGHIHVPDLNEGDALVVIGECEAIAYSTVRGGVRTSFQHEFRKSSRPVLAASSDGRRLYLLAGAYRFTERGIEDR